MLACKKKGEIPSCNKENDILRAAEREFLAKGFSGARTVSIAQAAGVTHAMLHYYFRTKEQLFERILDQKVQAMAQSVLASFGQPGLPLVERIRDGVECHFDAVAANPDLIRFVINEIFVYPERFQAMQQQMSLVIERLIADLQAEVNAACPSGRSRTVRRADALVGHRVAQYISLYCLSHHRAHLRRSGGQPGAVFRPSQAGKRRSDHAKDKKTVRI